MSLQGLLTRIWSQKIFTPAPRGAIHPAKRGRVRALAPTKAVAVATEPKRGTGRVLTSRASDAIVSIANEGGTVNGRREEALQKIVAAAVRFF
jgi:hypothetical protein